MNPIVAALTDVVVGLDSSCGTLSVTPLISRGARGPSGLMTLDEALARGEFAVTEVSDAGHVPELKVHNRGNGTVLLLDGEELIGAKQNRIVNLTILVPAMATLVIPVSCVEAGRWNRRSDRFRSSGNAHYARGRAHKVAQVTESLASIGEARSDQHWIWNDIAAKSSRLSAGSDTAAMSSMFEVHRRSVDEYLEAFPRVEGQIGAVFAIDETPVGLDLFDDEKIFRALFPKILRSYALDAMDRPSGQIPMGLRDERRSAETFINYVAESAADARRFPTVGLGEAARVESRDVVAAALVVGETLVHLAAFDMAGQR